MNKFYLLTVFIVTLLAFGARTNAQITNVPCNTTGTPWVKSNYQNLSVTTSTGLFGTSHWTSAGNVIDSNNSNKSTATILGVGTRWLRVTDNVNDYPAGTYAGYKIDLNDLITTFNVTLSTYLNGTKQETTSITSKISMLNLNGVYEVGMLTTKSWDAIQIEYTSLGFTGSIDVYHPVIKRFCAGPDLACNTDTKLVNSAYGTYISNQRTGSDGLSISSVTDEQNIIDSDPNNFAQLTNFIGKLGRAYVSVGDATKVHPAGSFAGYEIENAIATGVNFFNYITIQTYLNGTLQETKTGTALMILIPKLDFGNRRIFGIETTKPFNEVQITMNQPAGITLGTTKVYNLVVNKPCEGPALVPNVLTNINKPTFPVNINATRTGVSGLSAIAATVANADNILDTDPNNYATITVPKATGTNAAIAVKKSLADFPAGIYAGFEVEHISLININFLNAVSITTYNNGVLQETVVGSAQLYSAGSSLIASSGRNVLGFITSKAFDEIRLNISSVSSFDLGTTKVYGLVAMQPEAKQINCNSSYYWSYPEFPVVINMKNTGVYNYACAGCVVKDTGNLINSNPNDYASITMVAGKGNHGSISVVDPSATYPKGTFAGFTINDRYFPVQFDWKEFTTVKTYLDGVLQESKTSLDLFDKSLIIPIWGTGNRNVGFYTTKPFDEVQIVVHSLASFANRIDVYGVFIDTRSSNGDSISCLSTIIANEDNQTIKSGETGTISVLDNDTYNGAPATFDNVILTQVSTSNDAVTLDPTTGFITVAPNTPIGTYPITYQLCDKDNPTNCVTGTANVTVPNPIIHAVTETFPTIPTNVGGTTISVLANDTLGEDQATIDNVTLTANNLPAGLTMNPDGTITVARNTNEGTYEISYTICDKINPSNCSSVTSYVVVGAPAIVVVANEDTLTGVNSLGGTTQSVLSNDNVNGITANVGMNNVDGKVILTPGTLPAGMTMNNNGTVNVPAGTPASNYTFTYTICSYVDMSKCDTAEATVVVELPVIDAVADNLSVASTGGNTNSVLLNDRIGGQQATINNVNVTGVSMPNGFNLTANGTINVVSGTQPGVYDVTYKICDKVNPNNCDTATSFITVSGGPDLVVNGSASLPQAPIGSQVSFNFEITNIGSANAQGTTTFTVTRMSGNSSLVNLVTPAGWTAQMVGSNSIRYTRSSSINVGTSSFFSIGYTSMDNPGAYITLRGVVSNSNDTNTVNNTSQVRIMANP